MTEPDDWPDLEKVGSRLLRIATEWVDDGFRCPNGNEGGLCCFCKCYDLYLKEKNGTRSDD